MSAPPICVFYLTAYTLISPSTALLDVSIHLNQILQTMWSSNKIDPLSLYDVRNMITRLASAYGLEWLKLDTCCDSWVCGKVYKFDQTHYVEYGV